MIWAVIRLGNPFYKKSNWLGAVDTITGNLKNWRATVSSEGVHKND